jgi:hypothetical protein
MQPTYVYVYSSLCHTVHEFTANFRKLQIEIICFQVFNIIAMKFLRAVVDDRTRENLSCDMTPESRNIRARAEVYCQLKARQIHVPAVTNGHGMIYCWATVLSERFVATDKTQ